MMQKGYKSLNFTIQPVYNDMRKITICVAEYSTVFSGTQ
jgi:hypothetical protein